MVDYTEERRDQTRILEVKTPNIDGLDQMKRMKICRVWVQEGMRTMREERSERGDTCTYHMISYHIIKYDMRICRNIKE